MTAFDFDFTPWTESWVHLFSIAKTHLIVLHFCLRSSPLSPFPGKLVSLLSPAMPPLENQDAIATPKAGWPHLLRSSHGHVKFLPSLSIVIILFLASLPHNGLKQQQSLFHFSNPRPWPKIGSQRRSALFYHSSRKDAFLNDTIISKAK